MYQLDTVIRKWQERKDREREWRNLWAKKWATERRFSKMSQEELEEFYRKQRPKKLKEFTEFAKYVRELIEWHMITDRMFQRAIKFKKWEFRFKNSFEGMAGDKIWTLTKKEEARIENPGK